MKKTILTIFIITFALTSCLNFASAQDESEIISSESEEENVKLNITNESADSENLKSKDDGNSQNDIPINGQKRYIGVGMLLILFGIVAIKYIKRD